MKRTQRETLFTCHDEKGNHAALLTDLSKAFGCLPHYILLSKLYEYGIELPFLEHIRDSLSERKQKMKMTRIFSNWSDVIYGEPQG